MFQCVLDALDDNLIKGHVVFRRKELNLFDQVFRKTKGFVFIFYVIFFSLSMCITQFC